MMPQARPCSLKSAGSSDIAHTGAYMQLLGQWRLPTLGKSCRVKSLPPGFDAWLEGAAQVDRERLTKQLAKLRDMPGQLGSAAAQHAALLRELGAMPPGAAASEQYARLTQIAEVAQRRMQQRALRRGQLDPGVMALRGGLGRMAELAKETRTRLESQYGESPEVLRQLIQEFRYEQERLRSEASAAPPSARSGAGTAAAPTPGQPAAPSTPAGHAEPTQTRTGKATARAAPSTSSSATRTTSAATTAPPRPDADSRVAPSPLPSAARRPMQPVSPVGPATAGPNKPPPVNAISVSDQAAAPWQDRTAAAAAAVTQPLDQTRAMAGAALPSSHAAAATPIARTANTQPYQPANQAGFQPGHSSQVSYAWTPTQPPTPWPQSAPLSYPLPTQRLVAGRTPTLTARAPAIPGRAAGPIPPFQSQSMPILPPRPPVMPNPPPPPNAVPVLPLQPQTASPQAIPSRASATSGSLAYTTDRQGAQPSSSWSTDQFVDQTASQVQAGIPKPPELDSALEPLLDGAQLPGQAQLQPDLDSLQEGAPSSDSLSYEQRRPGSAPPVQVPGGSDWAAMDARSCGWTVAQPQQGTWRGWSRNR